MEAFRILFRGTCQPNVIYSKQGLRTDDLRTNAAPSTGGSPGAVCSPLSDGKRDRFVLGESVQLVAKSGTANGGPSGHRKVE
jgi:hypothetical protein